MVTISKNKLLDRWDTLPQDLRDAVFSDVNGDFVWKTCEDEHVPEEKIYTVSQIVGYVFLGFLHPEDVADEVKERLSLDPKTANAIQDALNKRIFTPLRGELDKIYAPVSTLEIATITATGGPKILQDISAALAPMPPAPAPKPTTLSDVGWSKASSVGPGIKLSTVSGAVAPSPAASIPMPAPIKPSEPAPVMLHEDTTFKAAGKNAGFTLSSPGTGAEVHMGQSSVPTPPRPAVLEFGGAKPAAAQPSNKPATGGAVHYTDLKLSLSAVPNADTGPRNVSQIAPAAPTPPTPPAPSAGTVPLPRPPQPPTPQMAKPPQPPTPPQNNKPIVKDFL